jgi:hypothetical protein
LCIVHNSKQLKEVFSQGMIVAHQGGGGEATSFVCGYMECDRELSKTFLGGLPPVFKVNIREDAVGQWLENSIKFSAAEASANRAGSEAVLARLSEVLFAETLRRYMAGCRRSRLAGSQEHKIRVWARRWCIRTALRNTLGRLRISPYRWECRDQRWLNASGLIWANLR